MNPISRRFRPLLLASALVAGTAAFSPLSPIARAADKSVETVLTESGLASSKSGSTFRVYIESDGQTTGVTVAPAGLGDSPDLKMIYLFTSVLSIPKGTKAPAPLLKRVAQINDNLFVGKLSLQEGENGGGIFYNSSLWLKTATGETLRTEIELAHIMRVQFAKELTPFLKDE